jgi:hypothetical protein
MLRSNFSISKSKRSDRKSEYLLTINQPSKSNQVKSSRISLHSNISIIKVVSGIMEHTPPPSHHPSSKKTTRKKSQLHRVYRTAPNPLKPPSTLSAVSRRRRALHLDTILRRLVRHGPMAGVIDVVGVVVDALAHAVHDDGAVDDLGEGADTVAEKKEGESVKKSRKLTTVQLHG